MSNEMLARASSKRTSARPFQGWLAALLATTVMLAAGSQAYGQEADPTYKFSGFGNVGVAHSSQGDADFTARGEQFSGAGHTRSWDFNSDSRLGVQLDAKFTSQFSGAAQVVSQQRYDGSDRPELMMAFGKWTAPAGLSFRVGRMPLPTFLISDYRLVDYSQTTIRPPVDLYHFLLLYHYDGADATWAGNLGSAAVKAQAYVGRMQSEIGVGESYTGNKIFGANVTVEQGAATFRLSTLQTRDSTLSSATIVGAFQTIQNGIPAYGIPGDPAEAAKYNYAGTKTSYDSAGFIYDAGNWFVTSEVAYQPSFSFIPSGSFAYVTAGWRLNSFTPYATLSADKPHGYGSDNPVLGPLLKSTAASGQNSVALGVRWDAVKNIAVKAQVDHVRLAAGSDGLLVNVQPGFVPGGKYNVLSAALAFVF